MRTLALSTAAALAALAVSTPAAAKNEDKVVLVVLGADPELPDAYGTGVFVGGGEGLPIVATCAHVINGQSRISIYLPDQPARQAYVQVTGIKADFEHDIAYLLLDKRQFTGIAFPAPVNAGFFPGAPIPSDITMVGFSPFRYPAPRSGAIMTAVKDLADFGPAGRKLPGGVGFPVVEVEDPSRIGQLVFPGDSGGPIYQGDNVVALAAGFVQVGPGQPIPVPFAVPLITPVPTSESAFDTRLPVSGKDPYGTLEVRKVVSKALNRGFDGVRVAEALKPCATPVGWMLGRYAGRADELPEAPGATVPEARCQDLYAVLREKRIDRHHAGRIAGQLESRARVERGSTPASTLPSFKMRLDEELRRFAQPDKKMRVFIEETLKSEPSLKPTRPTPPKAPSKADELELKAQAYRTREAAAAHEEKEILTTGVVPQRSVAPALPGD